MNLNKGNIFHHVIKILRKPRQKQKKQLRILNQKRKCYPSMIYYQTSLEALIHSPLAPDYVF